MKLFGYRRTFARSARSAFATAFVLSLTACSEVTAINFAKKRAAQGDAVASQEPSRVGGAPTGRAQTARNEGREVVAELARRIAQCASGRGSSSARSVPMSSNAIPRELAKVAAATYLSSADEWQTEDAFRCAGWSRGISQHLLYQWQATSPLRGVVVAAGDLDGDGIVDTRFSQAVECKVPVGAGATNLNPRFKVPRGWVDLSSGAPNANFEAFLPEKREEIRAEVRNKGVVFFAMDIQGARDGFPENVNARLGRSVAPITEAMIAESLQSAGEFAGLFPGVKLRIVESKIAKIADVTCGRTVVLMDNGSPPFTKAVQYYMPGPQRMIVLTYTTTVEAFPRYEAIFDAAAKATQGLSEPHATDCSAGPLTEDRGPFRDGQPAYAGQFLIE